MTINVTNLYFFLSNFTSFIQNLQIEKMKKMKRRYEENVKKMKRKYEENVKKCEKM